MGIPVPYTCAADGCCTAHSEAAEGVYVDIAALFTKKIECSKVWVCSAACRRRVQASVLRDLPFRTNKAGEAAIALS